VTLFAANRYVVDHVRAERLKRLHKQGGGSLSVHVEVAPDADAIFALDGLINNFNRAFNIREWR